MGKSAGYKALLQSLDENDVSRGLGRPVALKSGKKSKGCCFSFCRSWLLYSCVLLAIVSALMLAVGVPVMLTLPRSSPYHWTHWKQMVWPPDAAGAPHAHPHPPAGGNHSSYDKMARKNATDADGWLNPNSGNHTEPSFHHQDGSDSSGAHINGHTMNVIQKTVVQMRQMLQWSKEQYNSMPKIYLILALSTLLLVMLTVIWVLVYRQLVRRRRRRTLGKLVTDLQSGDDSFLLNSDSDDD